MVQQILWVHRSSQDSVHVWCGQLSDMGLGELFVVKTVAPVHYENYEREITLLRQVSGEQHWQVTRCRGADHDVPSVVGRCRQMRHDTAAWGAPLCRIIDSFPSVLPGVGGVGAPDHLRKPVDGVLRANGPAACCASGLQVHRLRVLRGRRPDHLPGGAEGRYAQPQRRAVPRLRPPPPAGGGLLLSVLNTQRLTPAAPPLMAAT